MKKILLSYFAAIWLFSAWEQGLTGTWAIWTSLGLAAASVLLTLHKVRREER